ncbi:hypothetical protein PFISCL1PPCAC_23805, partial [Pristionchus fissidentatus]
VPEMDDEPPNIDTGIIKKWKRKACNYSSEEKIGNLLLRAFDVMENVVAPGRESDKLEYSVNSMKTEMEHSAKYKDYRDSPLKDFIYGLCECISFMVKPTINSTHEHNSEIGENNQDLPYDTIGPSSVYSNFQYFPSKFEIEDMVMQNVNNRLGQGHSNGPVEHGNHMETAAAADEDLTIHYSSTNIVHGKE